MSDEPTSRRVTRSSRRINEGEQGPTSQQAIKAALPAPAAQVLDLAKPRGKAGRGRGRGSGSHGTGRRGGHTQAGGHEGKHSSQSSLVSFKLTWRLLHIYRFSAKRH